LKKVRNVSIGKVPARNCCMKGASVTRSRQRAATLR
jgi:hypothetical protein